MGIGRFFGKEIGFLPSFILIIIVFIIIKGSTFGWRLWGGSFQAPAQENMESAEILKSHVRRLSDEIGERSIFKYEKLDEAATYITRALESFGYKVEFQHYTPLNTSVKNIIATKIGTVRPQEVIIVGAHYDTCFNPGADDNASAVAGLLELARFLNEVDTERTIKFIAFVNEEPPFFQTEDMGSRVYVREAKDKGEDIKAVIILEMIGYYSDRLNSQRYPLLFGLFYPNRANFICVAGNYTSRWLVKECVSGFKGHTKFPIESFVGPSFITGIDFSDHWSFWKDGYPAVMITDTAFYRNPHYHSNTDIWEKLDYESMAEVIKGLRGALIVLSHHP